MNNYAMMSSIDTTLLSKIPQFRFIGSKHSMLHNISEVIKTEKIEGKTFFDVFSGSTSVSRYFKKKYSIISNDYLYFSYVLQMALIVLNEYPIFENVKMNSIKLYEFPYRRFKSNHNTHNNEVKEYIFIGSVIK